MTKMEFLIKKSQFSVKSRFKESKCADGGHSLNRDFTVIIFQNLFALLSISCDLYLSESNL